MGADDRASEKWLRRAATFGVLVPTALYMVSSFTGCMLLASGFVAGGSWEYSGFIAAIFKQEASRNRRLLQTACTTFVCLAGATNRDLVDAALLFSTAVLAAVAWQADGDADGKLMQRLFPRIGLELFGIWCVADNCYYQYLGWTMAHALLLRALPLPQQWFVCVLLSSFTGDTGALLIGRWARNSGMRVHGLTSTRVAGHLLASVGAAIAWGTCSEASPAIQHVLVVGVLVSTCCICGDLFESSLKRAADTKDSGSIFPGHGGFLDRLDGLAFAFPVVYLYIYYVFTE